MRYAIAVAAFLGACSVPTEAPDDAPLRPQFQKVANAPDGSGGKGGGASGGGGIVGYDTHGSACTLHGTNNSVECGQILMRIMTGGIVGAGSCRSAQCIAAAWAYTTSQIVEWRNQPDPWYEPWFNPGTPGSQGLWPPGVGGTYPIPIGGF